MSFITTTLWVANVALWAPLVIGVAARLSYFRIDNDPLQRSKRRLDDAHRPDRKIVIVEPRPGDPNWHTFEDEPHRVGRVPHDQINRSTPPHSA